MPRLRHPVTGGEFDAPPRSVQIYLRSGWTVAEPSSFVGETGGSSNETASSVVSTPAETGSDQES